MFKLSELIKKSSYLPKETAKILGVSTNTLIRYADTGKLQCFTSDKGHRRYTTDSIVKFLDSKHMIIDDSYINKNDVIYARVSSYKQKSSGDLERQINNIKLFLVDHNPKNLLVLHDVASGLNDNRPKLNKLIKLVLEDKVNRIFIMYKDRLTRFGFNYLKQICDFHNVEIVIVSDEEQDKSLSEELAEDIIAIIHSFSGKLYGMRKKFTKVLDKLDYNE